MRPLTLGINTFAILLILSASTASALCVRFYQYTCEDDPEDPHDCRGIQAGPSTDPLGAYHCNDSYCEVVGATSSCGDSILLDPRDVTARLP